MARLEEAKMYQEPETAYRSAQRQTMTSYAPPLCSRVDSDSADAAWVVGHGW